MKAFRISALAVTLLVLLAACVMQVQSGNAGDKNWLLLAARMWLQGKRLYVDIFELNPPLIIWLYSVPAWLALRSAILPDFEWLTLIGLSICVFSISLCIRLIRHHPGFAGKTLEQGYFALLLASLFIFFTSQVYFFDRDDIFFILTFPYMLRFMPSLGQHKPGLALRLVIGLFAAVGFCIKPHTLLLLVMVQLLTILRERRVKSLYSPESLIVYTGIAVYVLCIWRFTPEYAGTVLPMAWATYSGFNRRINGVLFGTIAFISAGLTFVDCRPRDRSPYRRDAYYFIGICVACLLYALSNNGWGYTYNPLLCMLLFCSGWMLWDYGWLKSKAQTEGVSGRAFAFGQQGCRLNLALNASYMLLCIGSFFISARCSDYFECKGNTRYAQYLKEQHITSFGSLSVNLRIWTSLARTSEATWETRFNHLWMLPKLLQGDDAFRERYRWIKDYVTQGLADDLDKRRPQVIFVDTSDGIFGYPHPVDIVAYFSTSPAFAQAWQNYRYQFTIDQCDQQEPKKPSPPEKKVLQNVTAKEKAISIDCRTAVYRRNP